MLQLIIVSFSVIRYVHINGCLCQCAYVMRIMRSFAEINKFSHMLLFNYFSTYLCSISPATKAMVLSGKFGHQVNSDTHLQTVYIQMRRLLMSRLIRMFTVCLVIFFYI